MYNYAMHSISQGCRVAIYRALFLIIDYGGLSKNGDIHSFTATCAGHASISQRIGIGTRCPSRMV